MEHTAHGYENVGATIDADFAMMVLRYGVSRTAGSERP